MPEKMSMSKLGEKEVTVTVTKPVVVGKTDLNKNIITMKEVQEKVKRLQPKLTLKEAKFLMKERQVKYEDWKPWEPDPNYYWVAVDYRRFMITSEIYESLKS